MNKKPTRADVARVAGVSVASVSRAVNHSGYVKEENKKRILQIAEEMGYNPNPIAVSLQSRKTHQLLLCQNDITAPYNIHFLKGAARAAYKRNYNIYLDVLCNFSKITERMVDGILFSIDFLAEKYLQDVGKNYYLPVVTAVNDDSKSFSSPVHKVMICNEYIVNQAIDYLQQKGHKKIGLVIPDSEYGKVRYHYWKMRMRKELREKDPGFDIESLLICADAQNRAAELQASEYPILNQALEESFDSYLSIHLGRRAAMLYAASHNPATAFLCYNDDMAYGFMGGLRKQGIRIPEDLSIMGVDGIYLRDWFDDKLTTVSIDPEAIGSTCTDILIDILEDKKPKYTTHTKSRILEGDTVRGLISIKQGKGGVL
jgi:DNA-binding LacI/PurR family transcriptional regulator